MMSAVIKTELRRGLRDRALLVLICLFAALATYAAWSGRTITAAHADAANTIVQKSIDQRAERRAEFAEAESSGAEPSRRAILPYAQIDHVAMPHASGAAISVSQIEAFPRIARVTSITNTHGIFDEFSGSTTNPETLAAGPFDLAFLIVFLLPLFVLAGTFDLWTSERERGVARQLLAEPIPSQILVAGKIAARCILLVLPLSIIAAIASASVADTGSALLLFVYVAIYSLFWVGLAGLINMVMARPTGAAITAGAAWLGFVLLLPAALAACLDVVAPNPSRAALANASRLILTETQAKGEEVLEAYLNQHPTATAELQVVSQGARRYYAVQLAADRAVAPAIEAHRKAEDRRRNIADQLRFLSPAVTVQSSLDRLAGFDANRALAFREQAYTHLEAMRAFVTPLLLADQALTASDYDVMPNFVFEEPANDGRHVLNLLALSGLTALFFYGVLASARRLET
ncbi:MAG: DUF3526 domain-containing protein, partial [Pseudomonadota bacterium]